MRSKYKCIVIQIDKVLFGVTVLIERNSNSTLELTDSIGNCTKTFNCVRKGNKTFKEEDLFLKIHSRKRLEAAMNVHHTGL